MNDENNKDNPLGLPSGSVRAIIALFITLLFGIALFFDLDILSVKNLLLMVLGFYFGSRK